MYFTKSQISHYNQIKKTFKYLKKKRKRQNSFKYYFTTRSNKIKIQFLFCLNFTHPQVKFRLDYKILLSKWRFIVNSLLFLQPNFLLWSLQPNK